MITVWLACNSFFCDLAFSSRFHSFMGVKDWTMAYCQLLSVYTPVSDTIHLLWIIKENWEHQQILLPFKFKKSLINCESSNHGLRLYEFLDLSNLTHVSICLVSCLKVISAFLFTDFWKYTTEQKSVLFCLSFPMFSK